MNPSNKEKREKLQAGDPVRVRLKEEIESTLDKWNQLKRCSFMEEMWPYCGTNQRVLKRVEKFLMNVITCSRRAMASLSWRMCSVRVQWTMVAAIGTATSFGERNG
jgi:hypothetical protein